MLPSSGGVRGKRQAADMFKVWSQCATRQRCRLVLLLFSLAELAASQTVLAFSVGRSPFEYECWWEKMEFRRLLLSLATRIVAASVSFFCSYFFFYNCAKQSMCQCLLLELYTFQATSGRVDKQTRLV